MSKPPIQKRILSQIGSGISLVDGGTFRALETLSLSASVRLDTLVGLVVFLQTNSELTLSGYDVVHGFKAPPDDVKAAWKALLFNGWITSTDEMIFLHLPTDEPAAVSPPATDWKNPLFPLAKAWGIASGEVVGEFPLKRLYSLYSKITFVSIPHESTSVCEFYHAALPDQTFESLVGDLSTDQEIMVTAAAAWIQKGRPELKPHLAAAEAMLQTWCALKERGAKRYYFFALVRASLLGVTPSSFEEAAGRHIFLDKVISEAATPTADGRFGKTFPLNLDALKPQ